MKTVSREAAQQRVDEVEVFRRELQRLDEAGVVSLGPAQREAIAAYHRQLLADFREQFDTDHTLQGRQLSLGMRIASFLGALALAASVFFLFFQYWGYFPEWAQVGILISAALGSTAGSFWVMGRDPSGYFSKLAAMVAFTCFVLNIAMLGQIFNITPSDRALLPWAALALIFAYYCDLRLLLAAAILCIIAYVAARVGTWGGLYWVHFGKRPENFIPLSFLLFFLPQFLDHRRYWRFDVVYRVFGMISLFLPLLILANWGAGSYLLAWLDRASIEVFYQLAGFVGSAAAIWYGVRRHLAHVVNTGTTFFVIFLYTKFFDWWWDLMPKFLFFLLMGLAALAFLLLFRRLRHSGVLQWEQAP